MEHNFSIALSFSATEAWIAKDLAGFLADLGIRTYCSALMPDRARGFFRKNLRDIYLNSMINVVLWSKGYAEKSDDSVVMMERDTIYDRHVLRRDYDSLYILRTDKHDVEQGFAICLTHDINTTGLRGAVEHLVDRISLAANSTGAIVGCIHPRGTESDRSVGVPCKFQISPGYKQDSLRRWSKLGDVQVFTTEPAAAHQNTKVYLIPSGCAPEMIANSISLKTQPKMLRIKKLLTEAFAATKRSEKMTGLLFDIHVNGVRLPHLYSPDYDKYLRENFSTALGQSLFFE